MRLQVRSDIVKPATRSIADNQNYGDDVSAQFLLYPQQFAAMGVEDSEFTVPKSKGEVMDIFTTCLEGVPVALLERAWELAEERGRGHVSIVSFQDALNSLL